MMAEINNGVDPKSIWDYKIGTDLWHSANNFIEYYKYVSFLETIQ
jgi:acyl-CoA oxidase